MAVWPHPFRFLGPNCSGHERGFNSINNFPTAGIVSYRHPHSLFALVSGPDHMLPTLALSRWSSRPSSQAIKSRTLSPTEHSERLHLNLSPIQMRPHRGNTGAPVLTQGSRSDPNLHFSHGGIVFPNLFLPRPRRQVGADSTAALGHFPMRIPLIFSLLALCACHNAGEWNDDPRSLARAWGKEASQGILAIHSFYWRSPHFTREEVYFFQFAPNPKLKADLIEANHLVSAPYTSRTAKGFSRTRPVWFAPGSPHTYSAWAERPTGDAPPDILLFEDLSSGSLFLYSSQM